jgi:predicted nucleotide-binding protein
MAKKAAQQEKLPPPELVVPRGEALTRLKERVNKGLEIKNSRIQSDADLTAAEKAQKLWNEFNSELLRRIFTNSAVQEEYDRFFGKVFFLGEVRTLGQKTTEFQGEVQDKIDRLQSIIERLPLIPESQQLADLSPSRPEQVGTRRVFVVHGHDGAVRETVARFVEQLGLEAVILHEQPNAGRTIIEKFEAYADVGFAVVLLTPDDVGAVKGAEAHLQPRARQNVILELGFFIGKLGRHKVCALHGSGVEIPSDISGVVYVPLDPAGAWRLQLAKELKQAKLQVDLNRAL